MFLLLTEHSEYVEWRSSCQVVFPALCLVLACERRKVFKARGCFLKATSISAVRLPWKEEEKKKRVIFYNCIGKTLSSTRQFLETGKIWILKIDFMCQEEETEDPELAPPSCGAFLVQQNPKQIQLCWDSGWCLAWGDNCWQLDAFSPTLMQLLCFFPQTTNTSPQIWFKLKQEVKIPKYP